MRNLRFGRGGVGSRNDVRPSIGDWDQFAPDIPLEFALASETAAMEWFDGFALRFEISSNQKNAVAIGAVIDETRPPDSFLFVQIVEPSHFGELCQLLQNLMQDPESEFGQERQTSESVTR